MEYKTYSSSKNKKPVVAVVGCLHGNELIGKKIIFRLRKLRINNGTLITVIANEKAIKKRKRFIKQDLNRSFPGKKGGNYEERLASDLLKVTKKADFVLDIHSTTTDVKNLVIITKTDKATLNLARSIKPKKIVLMKKDIAKKAFINYCKTGVSLEYGKDNSKSTYDNIFNAIMFLLEKNNMIFGKKRKIKNRRIEYYRIKGAVRKTKNDILMKNIKNFKLVEKEKVFATRNGKAILAKEDFYPVLFGGKSYENIFGFKAVEWKNPE